MTKKCCIPGCKSNYDKRRKKREQVGSEENKENEHPRHVPVFRFPSDVNEKLRWVACIPRVKQEKILTQKDPVVCSRHWPRDCRKTVVNGKSRPLDPPSIFHGVPLSVLPTPPAKPRSTTRTSATVRSTQEDELDAFKQSDSLTWESLKVNLSMKTRTLRHPVNCFVVGNEVQWILSSEMVNGIPRYSIRINQDLSYDAFHLGIPCTITTLSRNRINKLDAWSTIDEVVRFLHQKENSHHEDILLEQMSNMRPQKVGEKLYSPETIMRDFDYYAHSRSMYRKLRKDLKLPSERTLQTLTSKVSKVSDKIFVKSVFANVTGRQKKCVILIDEIYIKKMMLYHGGSLYGKAVNNPELMTNSVLTIIVKYLFGGPSFVFKMLPVAKMAASFLYQQVQDTLEMIREAGGDIESVICDGNRTNQKFFKMFPTVPQKPWLTTDGIFLLYDYVHLIKSIRNNWLTETDGKLKYLKEGEWKTAKWEHLIELYEQEPLADLNDSGTRGLSKLTEVAVKPKPIERQKVDTCLGVFCDETAAALSVHPSMSTNPEVKDTANFIRIITDMWSILNVRSINKDVRHNNPLEAVIESPDDPRLHRLLQMADMFQKMGRTLGH